MVDAQRLEDLRRRIQKDPASLAFAQLAEEYRRAGQNDDAIRTCRDGLTHHPTYLSARVTLGRALLAVGDIDAAEHELQAVLQAAPQNLAALRGLAEIHELHGRAADALAHYRAAQALAPDDPDLTRAIAALAQAATPGPGADSPASAAAPDTTLPAPAEAPGAQHAAALHGPGTRQPASEATLTHLERWLAAIRADRAARSADR